MLVTRATPGFIPAVAELVLGQMIDLARGISAATESYHRGEAPPARIGRQLEGSTLGVIGYGAIGRRLAEMALALDMRVLVADPRARAEDARIAQVGQPELLARSDFVVCLAVAAAETENLMDAAAFARMKRGAFFLNPVARRPGGRGGAARRRSTPATSPAPRSTSAAPRTRCRRRPWPPTRAWWPRRMSAGSRRKRRCTRPWTRCGRWRRSQRGASRTTR